MSARRTALITGSTDPAGIGFTAAYLLASKHGFNVILAGRGEEKAKKAAHLLGTKLRQEGGESSKEVKVFHLTMDVTDAASIEDAVRSLTSSKANDDTLADSYGKGTLDVLINNAGVGAPPGRGGKGTDTMFLQTELTTAQDMINVFTTNVAAVVAVTNAFLPLLSKSSNPRIVNVSSARGSLTFGSGLEPARTGAMVYNSSKTALNMVTLMQAKNLPSLCKPTLKVNAASPGHVKTPFNNFTGIRSLEEGAAVYVHLATLSDDGPTGQLIGNHAPFSSDGEFVQIPW